MSSSLADLKASFAGTFLAEREQGYDLSKWADNAQRRAKYVATPTDISDISKAVKFARANGLPLAIRGGGHGTSGSSACEGGVVVDMRNMRGVRVDKEDKVVYLQGGAVVKDVEEATIKYSLATAVGVCSQVGLTGFALAGGIGPSTGEYGVAADQIVSATVVLANGEIVKADEDQNSDLLWGLKGGGPNFGVVAELGMRLHPQRPDVYTCSYSFVRQQLPALVGVIQQWTQTQKPTESFALLFCLGPDGNPYITVNGFSNSDQEQGETCFKPFLDLADPRPNPDVFCELKGNKLLGGADCTHFDVKTAESVYDTWVELTKRAPASIVMYDFYGYDKVAKTPVESAAYAQRHSATRVLLGLVWTDEEFTPHARDAILNLKQAVSSASTKEAQEAVGHVNYSDIYSGCNETDEHARKLFGANYARLQELKRKYDPDVVWNRWFVIRPAA